MKVEVTTPKGTEILEGATLMVSREPMFEHATFAPHHNPRPILVIKDGEDTIAEFRHWLSWRKL